MKHPLLFLFAPVLCLLLSAPAGAQEHAAAPAASSPAAAPAAKAPKPDKALRIFLKTGAKKTYVRGYQWMTLDLNHKINLIEAARSGALQMNAVMAQPAEVYVAEVNKFFQYNPSLMQMELGQVIQGIAVSIKDWDDGHTEKK